MRFLMRAFTIVRHLFRKTTFVNGFLYSHVYRIAMKILFRRIGNIFDFRGASLVINTQDLSIAPTVWSGQYESNELDWMLGKYSNLREKRILLIDVGSNIGIYAAIFLRISNSFEAICIEPDQRSINFLTKNLESNSSRPYQYQIIDCAVGDNTKLQEMRFSKDPGQNKLSSLGSGTPTKLTSLDLILSEVATQSYFEIFLKVDVEGNETQVIFSGLNIFAHKRVSVLLEYNPTELEDIASYQELWTLMSRFYKQATVFTFGHVYSCLVLDLPSKLDKNLANILFEAGN